MQPVATASAGMIIALASNVINNLPPGLIASSTLLQPQSPELIIDSVLIGVDTGPNLSVTGSLATILWLAALRRDGHRIGALAFLKVGAVVMPPALLLALAALYVAEF